MPTNQNSKKPQVTSVRPTPSVKGATLSAFDENDLKRAWEVKQKLDFAIRCGANRRQAFLKLSAQEQAAFTTVFGEDPARLVRSDYARLRAGALDLTGRPVKTAAGHQGLLQLEEIIARLRRWCQTVGDIPEDEEAQIFDSVQKAHRAIFPRKSRRPKLITTSQIQVIRNMYPSVLRSCRLLSKALKQEEDPWRGTGERPDLAEFSHRWNQDHGHILPLHEETLRDLLERVRTSPVIGKRAPSSLANWIFALQFGVTGATIDTYLKRKKIGGKK